MQQSQLRTTVHLSLLPFLNRIRKRGGHFRTTFRTSAPVAGAEPQFRCEIDGAEPSGKSTKWRVQNDQK